MTGSTTIADAIAAEMEILVRAQTLPEMNIVRQAVYEFPQESPELQATVAPGNNLPKPITRGARQGQVKIVVVFTQKLPNTGNDVVDPLIAMVEDFRGEYAMIRALAGVSDVQVMGVEGDQLYDPNALWEGNLFVSITEINLQAN